MRRPAGRHTALPPAFRASIACCSACARASSSSWAPVLPSPYLRACSALHLRFSHGPHLARAMGEHQRGHAGTFEARYPYRRYAGHHHYRDSCQGAPHAPQQRARRHHPRLPAAGESPGGSSCREPRGRGLGDEPCPQDYGEGSRRARHLALSALPCGREPYREAPPAF